MPLYMRFLLLPIFLLLSALPTAAFSSPEGSVPVSASSVSASSDTLAPTFSLFPDWYTTPDRIPFRGPGLSAVAFLNPPMPLSPRNERRSFFPVAFGVGAELQFDKSNALRLHYGYVRGDYPHQQNESLARNFNRHTLNLDYLWNLSNHYFGYDPARSWELLAVAGATAGWAVAHDLPSRLYEGMEKAPTQQYFQGQIGLQVRKTLSPHLSAFVEPTFYVAQSNYDFFENGSDLDDGIALKAGLAYRLSGPLRRTPWFDHLYSATAPAPVSGATISGAPVPISGATVPIPGATVPIPGATVLEASASSISRPAFLPHRSFFVQNLLGLNLSFIKGWPQENHDLSNYNFSLAVGEWLHPAWGYRLAFVDRQVLPDGKRNATNRVTSVMSYRQTYARIEGLFNVPAFWDEVSLGRLGLDFSAGVEVGLDRQYKIYRGDLSSNYRLLPGVTSALQLKYHFNDYVALVGEGRLGYFHRRSAVFTPAIGVEYSQSPFRRFFTRRSAAVRNTSSDSQLSALNSQLFSEASLGFSKPSNQRFTTYPVSPLTEFAVGIELSPLYAVRLKEHLIYHRTRLAIHTEDKYSNFHSQLALDYLFDFTNYWMGIDPDRHVSLRPFAGMVYSARPLNAGKNTEVRHRMGFNFGLQHAVNVNRSFAFTLEPRYLSVIDDNNQWSLALGARYMPYRQSVHRQSASHDQEQKPSHGYLQLSGGVQLAQAFEAVDFAQNGSIDLTYGHNVIPNIDLQASLFYQTHHNNYGRVPEEHLFGFRLEAVAQFLDMIWPEANDRGYGLTVQGGYDFANSEEKDCWKGPSIATQFRRRLGHSPFWFTALGRLQARTSPSNNSNVSLHLGLHYTL